MTLNLKSTVSACFLLIASSMGITTVHAVGSLPSASSDASMSLTQERMNLSTRRKNRDCFTCVGPRGDRGCPGPRGNPGIAGLANLAAYEYLSPTSNDGVLPAIEFKANNPISFGAQTILIGDAIQSSSPFDSFTLAAGDYQIDVGVSNGNNLTTDLQLEVYLNNFSVPLFVWPATPAPPSAPGDKSPGFIEFSTIISATSTSNLLKIRPSDTITISPSGAIAGRTISFINILKLDREDNRIEDNCGS